MTARRVMLTLRADVTRMSPDERARFAGALEAQCEGSDDEDGYPSAVPELEIAEYDDGPPTSDVLAIEVDGHAVEVVSSLAGPDDDE